jgi:acyl-CoA synthetase (AMP-forming)/AMP-acid ligase II
MMTSMTLIDFFDKGVAKGPEHSFLVDANGPRSFRAVQETTHRLARLLANSGAGAGTRVAVFSSNSAQAFEAVLGSLRAGCVWVSVNLRNSVDDNIHVLRSNEVEVLFYAPELHDAMLRMREGCPAIRSVYSLGPETEVSEGYESLLARQGNEAIEVRRRSTDTAVILSSGGTTGQSKGVVLSQRAWQTMIFGMSDIFRTERPVMLVVAPMTHASGVLALGMMHMGTTNVILPAFDPVAVMQAIEKHRVTHVFLPPTAIYMMLSHPDVRRHDYSSLSHIICASAPMSIERMAEAIEVFGPVMSQMYGQTESMTTVTYHSPADLSRAVADPRLRHRLASVGKVCLVSRIEVMDDDGRLLPRGEVGEIVVRGDAISDGYYRNPEETAAMRTHDWHHTSDVGYIDEDGYVFIVDRKRDMIISGGFNIFPSEIEQVIWSHPSVGDCAVIGIPDEKWGEAVTAIVVPKAGFSINPDELQTYCRQRLASVKVPKSVIVEADLPRSAVGKVLKRVLRERFSREGATPSASEALLSK